MGVLGIITKWEDKAPLISTTLAVEMKNPIKAELLRSSMEKVKNNLDKADAKWCTLKELIELQKCENFSQYDLEYARKFFQGI